ncbi:MAG: 2-phospho-L-lactate guanylyltransferase [Myxococcota bacterium]|nr:2-phospho-L-lactate guanylyltransferase [Myxococcota bacterium]
MTAGLVPVKSLAAPKSRLRPHLGAEGVRALTLAMLGDVLEALLAVPELSRVAVATPDPTVARAAREAGALALLRDDPGLNAAIEAAAADLAPGAGDALLTVLGDVAGARPEELSRLLAEAPARGVALAPSRDGGTAALLRRPASVIPAGFGPASAKVHRELAERAGVPFVELPLPSLALDLDEPDDLESFLAGPGGGSRTRRLLQQLGREPA